MCYFEGPGTQIIGVSGPESQYLGSWTLRVRLSATIGT